MTCVDCKEPLPANGECQTDPLTPDHANRCCDCFDLSICPDQVDRINAERAALSKRPLRAEVPR